MRSLQTLRHKAARKIVVSSCQFPLPAVESSALRMAV
jgi:hypothetical protein